MECLITGCDCYYCARRRFHAFSTCKYYAERCYKRDLHHELIDCDRMIIEDRRSSITKRLHRMEDWAKAVYVQWQIKLYLKKGYWNDRILRRCKNVHVDVHSEQSEGAEIHDEDD